MHTALLPRFFDAETCTPQNNVPAVTRERGPGNAFSGLWPATGNAAIFLGVSIFACAVMIPGAWVLLDQAGARYATEEERLDKARTRHLRLDGERAMVDAYLPRFGRLVETGFIGEEHRLTWLEALRDAASRIGLPELAYDISSRRPYEIRDFPVDATPYRIHASEMQLTMGLLHEQDLFFLLTELDRHADGLYHVEYCRLRRVGWEPFFDRAKGNLDAECTLRWYSLDKGDSATAQNHE